MLGLFGSGSTNELGLGLNARAISKNLLEKSNKQNIELSNE